MLVRQGCVAREVFGPRGLFCFMRRTSRSVARFMIPGRSKASAWEGMLPTGATPARRPDIFACLLRVFTTSTGERCVMLDRRKFLKTTGAVGAAGALATPEFFLRSAKAANTIQVGVLFSLTGGLSIIEKSLADATNMAIAEI